MSKTAELFNECVAATPKDIKQRVEWSLSAMTFLRLGKVNKFPVRSLLEMFEIADKIDGILKERGMTQKEFARQVGRSEAEVCRWVGGTHNFTLATLAKISDALGVPMIRV